MGKAPKIPDWVQEELDGRYTIVPRKDGRVHLYSGKVTQPSGYPEMELRDNEIYHMDSHGFEYMPGSAGGLTDNLMLIAFTEGDTARPWHERIQAFYRERNALLKANKREEATAVYQKFHREAGLETMIAPDGVPREGLLAFCQRDGRPAAVYTRDNVELKLAELDDCGDRDEPTWRLLTGFNLVPRLCVLRDIEARYRLHLPLEQWTRIYKAMGSRSAYRL